MSDIYKTAEIYFITSRAVYVICSSYYICVRWCRKVNFCCFVCVAQQWATHVVLEQVFSYIYICDFFLQSTAEIKYFSFEKKWLLYWNSNSCINFGLVVSSMSFCISLSNFIQIGPPRFLRWWPRYDKSTFSFGIDHITRL